ncbi:MAG: autotransporter-associated beta strand repeat-containing protein [Thermoguttaceae bacterium]|nr:autotransporter-associated beta strand repeat-containing protein [Thermoguttaceae bacterium]
MKTRIESVILSAAALAFCLVGWASAQTLKTDAEIEAMGYTHIYSLSIPDQPNFRKGAPYTLDNSSLNLGPLESVAYRLNLGEDNFCYTSFGAYTSDLTQIGVPTFTSHTQEQRYVQNLYYEAKSPTLTTAGTTVTQGNIEFWPWNYSTTNAANIPGASGASGNRNYDFGDSCSYGGAHGSMQVHDYTNKTTIFALNRFNDGANASIGIGNCADTTYGLDWTTNYNSASYETKQLDVYAKPVFLKMSESDFSAISGEVSNMKLVYKLDCPLQGTYSANNYQVNNVTNSDISGMPLSRVGYYMVMEKADGSADYAYTSFDATTNDLTKIGMPFDGSVRQQTVTNMTVQSNVAGVVNGKNISTGNIEMWKYDYSKGNAANIPGANANDYDFGDTAGTGGSYSCFQIHNYGAGQTIMALNKWNGQASGSKTIDMGIGNNTGAGSPDYTFNGDQGANSNASQYQTRSLYVLAEAAIAPEMQNVVEGSKYQIVQGARLTSQMATQWNADFGGVNYDIVDNVAELKQTMGPFDRVGYYMEYAQNASDDLKYVFVSFDAMTADISKIGVPTNPSGEFYQQKVKNLHVTTNATASDGLITDPGTGEQVAAHNTINYNTGYLEFWASNYSGTRGTVITQGSDSTYDINDSGGSTGFGHGSMQIHSLDTEQTIFALNHFNGTKQFGIGTNPTTTGAPDWTNNETKKNYAIANVYTFAKPVLSDMDAEHFQPIQSEAANMDLVYKLDCPLYGTYTADNYVVNNLNNLGDLAGMPLKRVAYYMTLEKADGSVDYAYASYDSITNDPSQIGLPLDGAVRQTTVNNLTVSSNVAGVVNGTGLNGNIEMWNRNYTQGNSANIPGASGTDYDFGDTPSNGSYASFQIHNYGDKQTVMALNAWNGTGNSADRTIDIGIGNNTGHGSPDYTFNGEVGANSNASQYVNRTLYVMAERDIAPCMANVASAADYTMVQGARLTTQMNTNWHTNGVNYDIVDNLASLQSQGVLFDRVGYYMEYAQNAGDPLTYVFVSFDAMTHDLSKIGVPTSSTGEFYAQKVNNLEFTTNVASNQGKLFDPATGQQVTANTTYSQAQGYIEFWPNSYTYTSNPSIEVGSGSIYDVSDTPTGVPGTAGYGSMQIHSLETGQTIFSLNRYESTKAYGIGTNPSASANSSNGQADYTFDYSKSGYKIANVYTFVHQVDALLTTNAMSMYQRDVTNYADVTLSGTWAATNGVTIDSVLASVDGGDWISMTLNADGTFSSDSMSLKGGMHSISYKALDASGAVITTTAGQIGVGEIFITAGQSNSTNCGDIRQTSTSGFAFAYNPATGQWEKNCDVQYGPLDGSNKGSTWPSFADTLAEEEGVPVATYSVGFSGTNISQWINDEKGGISTNMLNAIRFLNENADGFAGILWHQGESDKGTDEQVYYDKLNQLIDRTREAAGDDELPWGVAIASADGSGNTYENVTNAQRRVIADDPNIFEGVNTDEFCAIDREHASDPDYETLRGTNGNSIHLSDKGLTEAGRLWALTAGESIVGLRKYWLADTEEAIAFSDWEVDGGYKLGVKLVSGEALSVEAGNSVQMADDGTVEVGEGYSLTLTKGVSGTGNIEKIGDGTLTLSGAAEDYSGKTTITAGTLKLTGAGSLGTGEVVNNVTLEFAHDTDQTFANKVSGTAGTVLKTGAGNLKINAAQGFEAANLTVSAGRLDFLGSTTGSITIENGVFSPGNSVGTANVGGAFTLANGGSVVMEIGGTNPNQNDALIATGDLNLIEGGLIYLELDRASGLNANDDFIAVLHGSNSAALAENFIENYVVAPNFTNLEYRLLEGSQYGDYAGLYAITGTLFEASGVPEPATWVLLLLGSFGLLYWRKGNRK